MTLNTYEGDVLLQVSGVGQSYANVYNDAFYLFTGPFPVPTNGHDGGFYQLTFGTGPLGLFDRGNNADNFLAGPLPAYNPAHEYTFVLNRKRERAKARKEWPFRASRQKWAGCRIIACHAVPTLSGSPRAESARDAPRPG